VRSLIVLVALAAAAVFASTAAAITAPPTTYADPSGDGGTAPDITGISVTNDDHGLYTFNVTLATPYSDTAGAEIFFDADQNTGTGDQIGAEYVLLDDHASHSFFLYKWSGSQWQEASASTADVSVAADNMSITFAINKSDLGNVTQYNFFVLSTDGDGSTGHYDDAPSGSDWFTYGYKTVFTLASGSSHDGAAKAGGTWSVSMSAVRSDGNGTVGSEGTIACKATAGSKKLAVVSHSFVSAGGGGGSTAVCTFRVPKADKHKKLRATVTVSESGETATKSFAATAK
jgi:hypothetical protein